MKRIISGLIVAAALTSATAFAGPKEDKDLCDVNLQKIKDGLTVNTNMGEPLKKEITDAQSKAIAAQKAGHDKDCVGVSGKALQSLQNVGKSQN
ncbi:hypothetical protein [Pseudomonas sp. nanlin1]|uniref:hypothetical protein n=1 Tax=Pseudomonas sp. nanlin1 TaxID=3040605 RepID=UPI00388FF61F